MANELHYINMNGLIKLIRTELAFDRELQSQMDYFPCDENGNPVSQAENFVESEKKSVNPVAASSPREPEIILPELSEIKTDEVVSAKPSKRNQSK